MSDFRGTICDEKLVHQFVAHARYISKASTTTIAVGISRIANVQTVFRLRRRRSFAARSSVRNAIRS